MGYDIDFRELRACDYGAPTTRKRFFMMSRSDGYPIAWPEATHGAPDSFGVKNGILQPYKTAAECIDWSVPVKSIFDRPRPLSENTMVRIARGIKKFILDNPNPFTLPADSVAPFITECANASNQRNMRGNEPLRTITAQTKGGTFAVVAPIIERQFGTAAGNPIDAPLGTIMSQGGGGKSALVTAFLAKHYGGNYTGAGIPMSAPTDTITTTDHHALVSAFLLKYYGSEKDGERIDGPLHTIPTKDRFGLVVVRGDLYRIVDIGMRMLTPAELFKAQGFLPSYVHDHYIDAHGITHPLTKTDQVRMVGNSVSPPIAAAILKANIDIRNKIQRMAA